MTWQTRCAQRHSGRDPIFDVPFRRFQFELGRERVSVGLKNGDAIEGGIEKGRRRVALRARDDFVGNVDGEWVERGSGIELGG